MLPKVLKEGGAATMAYPSRKLTDTETEEFLKENRHGILSFSGEEAYAVPIGYQYKIGTVLLGFATGGRKWDCFQKSPKVCFTVCKPFRWHTPDLKESCTSVILEGELEEVTQAAYYGLPEIPPKPPGEFQPRFFSLKVDQVGTRKCRHKPCELLAQQETSK